MLRLCSLRLIKPEVLLNDVLVNNLKYELRANMPTRREKPSPAEEGWVRGNHINIIL